MQLPFPVLFIPSCRPLFPLGIMFFLSEGFPLTFLVGWVCLRWILLALVCLKSLYFTFTFERAFSSHRIQCPRTLFSFQRLRDTAQLSSTCIASCRLLAVHLPSSVPYVLSPLAALKMYSSSLVLRYVACFSVVFFIFLVFKVCWASWTHRLTGFVNFGKV